MSVSKNLIAAAAKLREAVNSLTFSKPVTHVYNPLDYAWEAHQLYLTKYANSTKKVVMLGMNPGPFGMAQTGVPFGEIPAVRDWMKIEAPVGKPAVENPKRPVEGFACTRSEVSGRRLWGLMAERFGAPENFFADHIILNYCPLVFMEESGRNVTPDKIPAAEKKPLTAACDAHLREVIKILEPEWCIGVGGFATKCLERILGREACPKPPLRSGEMPEGSGGGLGQPSLPRNPQIGTILHPSPANPHANRDWAGKATAQLEDLGAW